MIDPAKLRLAAFVTVPDGVIVPVKDRTADLTLVNAPDGVIEPAYDTRKTFSVASAPVGVIAPLNVRATLRMIAADGVKYPAFVAATAFETVAAGVTAPLTSSV